MSKKNIAIIIVLIILIIGIAYLIYQFVLLPQQQIKIENELIDLLESLKQETEISFSKIESVELKWNVKRNQTTEELIINGKGFRVNAILEQDFKDIESFFQDKGFSRNAYNVGSLIGYRKDYTICTIAETLFDKGDVSSINERYIEVKCGNGDELIDSLISKKEQIIQELFAQEYKTSVFSVGIYIEQETENHLRASFQIVSPLTVGKSSVGTFLAVKINNNWQLAFNGTGLMFCEDLKEYDFPGDMIKDCSKTIRVKNYDNFSVVLPSDPSTDYQWKVDFNPIFIESINREYIPFSGESGGEESFNFLALRPGKTNISFVYYFLPEEWKSLSREEISSLDLEEGLDLNLEEKEITMENYGIIIE